MLLSGAVVVSSGDRCATTGQLDVLHDDIPVLPVNLGRNPAKGSAQALRSRMQAAIPVPDCSAAVLESAMAQRDVGTPRPRPRFAPKAPLGWIVQLYRRDALGIQDPELVEKVGGRLYARCLDVLAVSDSLLRCPVCDSVFEVPWIGQPVDRLATCPTCDWSITSGEYHASFEHQDLLGANARGAFARFVEDYPRASRYTERMLPVDRLIHAVHTSGNAVVRNLIEGQPRKVLAILDQLATGRT